jgi:mannosyltransferase
VKWDRLWIPAALLAGAWLRFHHIAKLSLWFDEGYTAWAINHPPSEIIRLIRADTGPPLYYLVLHAWTLIFGRSETALRGLSALLGTATIALAAAIARRLLGRPAAVLAATGMVVFSFPQIWYSQEARGYEMMSFLTAVMVYCLVRHLARPNWKWLALLITAGAAGLYVHNLMALYVFGVGLAGLVLPSPFPRRRRLRDVLLATACLTLFYLPWLASLGSQIDRVSQDFWISRPTRSAVEIVLVQLCGLIDLQPWDRHPELTASMFLGILILCAMTHRKNGRTNLALAIAALVPPLAAAMISLGNRPVFLTAAFLPSTVLLSILIAGIVTANRAGMVYAIALIALSISAWRSHVAGASKEDWRGAAAAVAAMPAVPHRLIVFVANEGQLPFDYYYHARPGEMETGAPAGFLDIDPPRTLRRVLTDSDLDALRRLIASQSFDDLVLIVSHAGWIDKVGQLRLEYGYADPQARTARYVLGTMRVLSRVDLPDEPYRHDITIWRCAR